MVRRIDAPRTSFDAVELDVRRGRLFRAGEALSTVVVDELFVRTHQLPEPVVGVVEDAMFMTGWDRPLKGLYLPMGAAIGSRATLDGREHSAPC